jgi:hypothetical protein
MFDSRLLDVRVKQDLGPEASNLMGVVNLHDVKLLDNLVVDLNLAALESRNDFLTKVDSEDVMQLVQRLNLLVSNFDLIDHGVSVSLDEHRLHGLSSLSDVVQLRLLVLLSLLVAANATIDLVSFPERSVDGLDVERLTLAPVIQVEVRVLEPFSQLRHAILNRSQRAFLAGTGLRVREDHSFFLAFDILCQVELLILVKDIQHRLIIKDVLALVLHVK